MARKLLIIPMVILLLAGASLPGLAAWNNVGRDYAFGWQFFRPATGLSLKIPLSGNYDLQPILAIKSVEKEDQSKGHFALGIRGIYNFPARYDFHPYTGVGLGHFLDFRNVSNGDAAKNGGGYEAFFGVEYQKYLLRPALEIGLGSYNKVDGSHYSGMSYNLSLLYYF